MINLLIFIFKGNKNKSKYSTSKYLPASAKIEKNGILIPITVNYS